MSLTESQKKAVRSLSGNVLVSAGAGTGKTLVLVERVLHILKNQKADITELLVLTFTEKAANEIKTRLSSELHKLGLERMRRELEQAAIGTFHGFASRLLKEHPVEAAVDPDFRVLESEQADFLKEESLTAVIEKMFQENRDAFELLRVYGEGPVRTGLLKVLAAARHEGKTLRGFFEESLEKRKKLLKEAEYTIPDEAESLTRSFGDEFDPASWQRFVQNRSWGWDTLADFRRWKTAHSKKRKPGWKEWRDLANELANLRLEPLAEPGRSRFEAIALEFEAAYEASKKKENFLDFDDLQIKAVKLFESKRPALQKIGERYREKFRYILVDEFQDTNFLQTRFIELLSSGDNVFVVGDYKQSIYGFRGAEPSIFRNREKKYLEGEEGLRIALLDNFRTFSPLLGRVNDFFKELWEEDRFPFEPLTSQAQLTKENDTEFPMEVLITNAGEDEGKEHARMREAFAIAGKIKALHDQEGVPYGDMAVLFQAMTLSGIYEHAMKALEIPYYIMAGRGFYYQPEIQDMVSFLTHLEKPLLDIPLAATLRSPFFHITDDSLFWLARSAKAQDEKTPLAYSLKDIERIKEIDAFQRKTLRSFTALAEELRRSKDRVPLAELIDMILDRTGYELALLADRGGSRRYANLKKLIAMVREYETHERMPLAKFLAVLKRLQVQEVRESEAQVSVEKDADAVRMMTIHASKGLEFGTVFVADMGREGGHSQSKAVIAHASDGYALRLMNDLEKKDEKPFFYQQLDRGVTARENEERKRLFYVACTRAKERLVLSGIYEKRKNPKERYGDMLTWMDWAIAIGEKIGLPRTHDLDRTIGLHSKKLKGITQKLAMALKDIVDHAPEGTLGDKEPEKPFPRSIDLPVSAYVLFNKDPLAFWRTYQVGWSVSGEDFRDIPEDPDEGKISAADFGTAMHSLLERLDIKDPGKYLEQDALDRIFSGFDKKAIGEARKLLKEFFKSSLFKQLQRAKSIHREIDFVLNERHGLIQGKLDMLFEDEKGDWHILDYKTAVGDEVTSKENGYDLQIEIYALAAHKILGLPARSGILYYLKNGKEVSVKFPGGKEAAAFFEKVEKRICGFQEKILNFSNQKMLQARPAERAGRNNPK